MAAAIPWDRENDGFLSQLGIAEQLQETPR